MTDTLNTLDPSESSPLSYKDAGVDISAGNELIDSIKPLAQKTHREGVLGSLGGFAALFELPLTRFKKPVLVSCTDGVGTKLKLAMAMGAHDSIGIDLVAMCVNDLIVQGAEPLFFLDYYATGKLDVDIATNVIKGIAHGCELARCSLVGGETAEMPGMYQLNDYDLAGFCVGIVEKDEIIDGSTVQPGDQLIGLASSGPHSNGYSLIRKILDITDNDLLDKFHGRRTLGETLLEPTRIYVNTILSLLKQIRVKGLCHITGGGLVENLPRILPDNCQAVVTQDSWRRPPIFKWIMDSGNISEDEMLRTFNCGIGMVAVVDADSVEATLQALEQLGEKAYLIGDIQAKTSPSCDAVVIN